MIFFWLVTSWFGNPAGLFLLESFIKQKLLEIRSEETWLSFLHIPKISFTGWVCWSVGEILMHSCWFLRKHLKLQMSVTKSLHLSNLTLNQACTWEFLDFQLSDTLFCSCLKKLSSPFNMWLTPEVFTQWFSKSYW